MMNGKIIDGRYEIIEEIGRGGMAIVYRAKCLVLNRYVAIKVLRPEYRDDAEFIKRFKIEAQSAGSLSHPNIVSIYDVGNEDDIEYIVMEYVEGITLKQYVNTKGVLQWKEAVDYASQICSGLEHAHKKGIVHKDIKPENIIITKEGILKITDFGIAKALNQGTIATGGLTMGSVHYFSPEQARGGFTDAKTDLYSLGILLYEMVTGKLPFDGDSAISVAMQHLEKDPTRPSVFNMSIPRSLETVILKAMKKEQSERYQSATQMLIDLKKVYVGSDVKYNNADHAKKMGPATANGAPAKRPGASQSPARKPNGSAAGAKRPAPKGDSAGAKKKKKKKGDALGIAAGITAALAVLAVIFVCVIFFSTGGSNNEVTCPDLVNLTCAEALDRIDEIKGGKKLKVVLDNGKEISGHEEGIIVSQNPKSGIKIKNNAKITVVLGDKPVETEVIPSLYGKSQSDAKKQLEALGFAVRFEVQDHNDLAAGRVIGTSPAAGETLSKESVVTVYVSSGKEADNNDEYTEVPRLIGLSLEEAERELERAGLSLGETKTVSSSRSKGTVVDQSRSEGDRVKKNTGIDLEISSGRAASTPTPTPTPTSTITSTPTATPTPGNPSGGETENSTPEPTDHTSDTDE